MQTQEGLREVMCVCCHQKVYLNGENPSSFEEDGIPSPPRFLFDPCTENVLEALGVAMVEKKDVELNFSVDLACTDSAATWASLAWNGTGSDALICI